MTKAEVSVGAYWGPRADSINTCASLLIEVVGALSRCDPPLQSLWYSRDSPREQRRAYVPNQTEVARALDRGRSRSELDGDVLDDLGFLVAIDEGRDRWEQGKLMFSCGTSSPRLWNFATVVPPETMPVGEAGSRWLRQILVALIEITQPAWGRVDNDRFLRSHEGQARHRAGWMLYMAVPVDRLPILPEGATVTPEGEGVLIESTTDWFDPDNPAHVRAADEIDRRLDDAGLLLSAWEASQRPRQGQPQRDPGL